MSHVRRFQSIPMSKSMRGLCKEEDYEFLGRSESTTGHCVEGPAALENDWRDKKEERVHRRLEREKKEKERLKAIEERRKEKEQQWKTHIAELTSRQDRDLQGRLKRLQRFREFQRKVLAEEEGMDNGAVGQILTRM